MNFIQMIRVIYRRAPHAGASGPLCFARMKWSHSALNLDIHADRTRDVS